jgi:hypothetical protein
VVLAGDFNVIPTDFDVYPGVDPDRLACQFAPARRLHEHRHHGREAGHQAAWLETWPGDG